MRKGCDVSRAAPVAPFPTKVVLDFVEELAKIRFMFKPTVCLLTSALVGTLVSSCSPDAPRFALKSTERRGVLESNGLRFVIMPDATTQLVQVDVHYDVGSREDPMGKAGI